MITWDTLKEKVNQFAKDSGEWAGAPLPVENMKLVLEPRYPYQGLNGFSIENEETKRKAREASGYEGPIHIVNSWYCFNRDVQVFVWHDGDGRSKVSVLPERHAKRYELLFNTLSVVASPAIDVNVELRALATLREHITDQAFRCYMVGGMFIESSKRSKIFYVFRKQRPTLALGTGDDGMIRPLCALCLHPIGYYEDSFAGVMCPTDDVIAHLLMMRGDERKFWAKANHHALHTAQSGI